MNEYAVLAPTPWLRGVAQEVFQAFERGELGRCMHAARKPNRPAFVALWSDHLTITCLRCSTKLADPSDGRCAKCDRPDQVLTGVRALLGGQTYLCVALCPACRLAEVAAGGDAG